MNRAQRWPRNVSRFVRKRPTSIIVYLLFSIFLLLWVGGLLGTYLVAVGTVLGSVAIAVSSIGPDHIRDKWIVAAVGTTLVGICTIIDTSEQLRILRLKSEFEKDMQEYGARPDTKHAFVAFLDRRLAGCVNTVPVNVDHCDDLESLLEHIDVINGGVYFFRAEILRSRGRFQDSDDQFDSYLEADGRLRPTNLPDSGYAIVCADNGTGYCRQRTAWVCHSLANDLYRRGCTTVGIPQRRYFFKRAQEKLQCVEREYGSFDQRLGTRPLNSADLSAALKLEVNQPGRVCDSPPKP